MKHARQKDAAKGAGWLLFFYSVPSKPVSNRIKVWRRLAKAGAIQLKGAGYMLPHNEGHYELFQWLVSEVEAMKGEAAFVHIDHIETMEDDEIIGLFNRQRERDYRPIEKKLEELERKISSARKGSASLKDGRLPEQLGKYVKAFEEVRKLDFFSSGTGDELGEKIKAIEEEIKRFPGAGAQKPADGIQPKALEKYQGKTWVTRKRPFVDRMASAWLIKKFIDQKAVFGFIHEQDIKDAAQEAVIFDIRGGEFTHVGDMCTFEVLMKSFGIRDRALRKMAEVVHELDVEDEKYRNPAAKGIEEILTGIRKTARDDTEALEKGMNVFEMLYVSKG